MVLLHLLSILKDSLGFHLICLHVNHGLSPNAAAWEAFCRQLCAEWRIELRVRRVQVDRDRSGGLEAAARRARHAVFAATSADWLVLAHHRDDQAETLLLNLLRGGGVGGAAAMSLAGVIAAGDRRLKVLRPLLEVPRKDIRHCAEAAGLRWVEDESNAGLAFSRNYLRHEILPRLVERFPAADAALARAAGHFAEAEALLDELAQIDLGTEAPGRRLPIDVLVALEDSRARNLLRYFLKRNDVSIPSAERLAEILRQFKSAREDRQVAFALGHRLLSRYRREALLSPRSEPLPDEVCWRGEASLAWPGGRIRFVSVAGQGISAARVSGKAVWLRPRAGGERLQPDCRRPRRSLKNLFQEAGVAPHTRRLLPLVWCESDLVCVPGIGVDCSCQCAAGEPGWVVQWEPAD